MKKIILFFSVCMFTSFIQAQCLEWVKRMGDNSGCNAEAITIDLWGNVYITGYIQDTMDFAPDNGSYFVTTGAPISGQIFVVKFDVNGNLIWAKATQGLLSGGVGSAIVTDVDGSVYTTGYFVGAIDFDPGPGSYVLGPSYANNQLFIMKWDSSGNFRWTHSFDGNNGYNVGNQIKVTQNNKVLVAGCFSDTVDFDPGIGTFQLVSEGNIDACVLQLDTAGNFMWVKSIGGIAGEDISGLAIDPDNNIIVKGVFKDSIDLDPGPGTFDFYSADTTHGDIFMAKLDPSGNFMWGKAIFNTNDDYYQHIESDDAGNIYTVGYFSGAFDVDPGPGTHMLTPAFGANDLYWLKMDGDANLIWAGQTTATSPTDHSYISDMVIDSSYAMYTTGFFKGQIDFDPGAGVAMRYATNPNEIFISKIDSGGNFIWTRDIDNSHNAIINAMVVNASYDLFLYGGYSANLDVDPCANEYFINPVMGYGNLFLAKIPQDLMEIENELENIDITVYPNPTTTLINISSLTELNGVELILTGINGQILMNKNHLEGNNLQLDLSPLNAGMYFLYIYSQGKEGVIKVVKN